MRKILKVALVGLALVAVSCGSGDDAVAGAVEDLTGRTASDSTSTTVPIETEVASAVEERDDRPAAFGAPCSNAQLPNADQMAVSADGGLRARALPGTGDVIEVIANGTVVNTLRDESDCGVQSDGSVWFRVGSGGWVHSGFLRDTSDVAPGGSTADQGDSTSSAAGEACSDAQLPTSAVLTVNADNGLRARVLPGTGTVIDLLPDGSPVDAFSDASRCSVQSDGSVWYDIESPILSNGGWVHSGFLEPAS